MLHCRAPYIAPIFEISIEMLQCNKSECETVLFVEFCGMSQQSKDGMGAAEAKLTELVALVLQLQTGWKFIVDYHRARMRGKRSLSCHWWAALSAGTELPPSSCSNICCAAAISFPLGGTRSNPAMLPLRDLSDRSHRLAHTGAAQWTSTARKGSRPLNQVEQQAIPAQTSIPKIKRVLPRTWSPTRRRPRATLLNTRKPRRERLAITL